MVVWCGGTQVSPCGDTLGLETDWLGWCLWGFSSEGHWWVKPGFLITPCRWGCLRVQQYRLVSRYAEQKLLSPITVQHPRWSGGPKPGLGGVICLCLQGPEAWLWNWDVCVNWQHGGPSWLFTGVELGICVCGLIQTQAWVKRGY